MSSGDSSVLEHQASDRKVAYHWFNSRTGNASLWPRKDTLRIFPLGPSSLPFVVGQFDERLANKTQKKAVRWCGEADVACLIHMNKRTLEC